MGWLFCYVLYLKSEFDETDPMSPFYFGALGWLLPLGVVIIVMLIHFQNYTDAD
jgi:hypothetical protein